MSAGDIASLVLAAVLIVVLLIVIAAFLVGREVRKNRAGFCPRCGNARVIGGTDFVMGEAGHCYVCSPAHLTRCLKCQADVSRGARFCETCGSDSLEQLIYTGSPPAWSRVN